MKVRKPNYFQEFQCIGSDCKDTCCAGWEIEIDEEALEKYHTVGGTIGTKLSTMIVETPEENYFQLQEGKRCPFLTKENLCQLILELGEDSLCNICREHPRHYTWFGEYTEIGLGLCCEEAGRLLFQSSEAVTFILEETQTSDEAEDMEEEDRNYIERMLDARETAYHILQNRLMKLPERLILLLEYGEELQQALDTDDYEELERNIQSYRNQASALAAWRQYQQIQRSLETDRQQAERKAAGVECAKGRIALYASMEALDGHWKEYLLQIRADWEKQSEIARDYQLQYPASEYEYEHFAVYLCYRYFMEALFDGDILGKLRFLVSAVLTVHDMDLNRFNTKGSYQLQDRIELVKWFSKEIEYCTENMERIAKECWQEPSMMTQGLISQLELWGEQAVTGTILFDMDGTLLDTEKYYRRYWQEAAKACGYPMTDEQALSMRSLGKPYAQQRITELFGDPEAYGKIRAKRSELMNQKLKQEGIPVKPYAKEALAALQNMGYRLVVVTATDMERTSRYLQETGLRQYFDAIICATMVERGKPAPDVYQYACQSLQVLPAEVYAVEDSPNGVRSAVNAGCQVIMIPDQTQPDAELMKVLTQKAESLKELVEYIRLQ